MIPDRELDGLRLAAEIDALAADPQRLSQMDQAARGAGPPRRGPRRDRRRRAVRSPSPACRRRRELMAPLDLSRPTRVHVVGAGGAGMGAIASVLRAMGHEVTGSDLKESQVTERLRAEGVPVSIGHDPANVGAAAVVAISSAIGATNPEVQAARRAGIPVVVRSEVLPAIASVRRTIAVAGTHGKTTTSSMLALVLVEAGLNPSFVIGGDLNEIGTGGVWGEGDWFVIEADESDHTFLALDPDVAVVTSIEPDHLEAYGEDRGELESAFATFLEGAEARIVCADDPTAATLARSMKAVTYGTHADADYRMTAIDRSMPVVAFDLSHRGRELGRIELPTPGLHNARNAAAAAVTAMIVGAPFDAAVEALGRFGGVARRFEFRGAVNGVTFVDDYAHLPSEVAAALAAARDGDEWDRIVCVFQPHRYSRIAAVGCRLRPLVHGCGSSRGHRDLPLGRVPSSRCERQDRRGRRSRRSSPVVGGPGWPGSTKWPRGSCRG